MADQWLYRSADLILGPVPAAQIIEKIYSHELDGKSEVQVMGTGQFRRLIEIEAFRVHLAKADVKRKVDKMADASAKDRATKRNITLAIAGVVIAVIAGAVIAAGQYLAVHTPGKTAEDLYADLITVDPPTVTRARAGGDEELVDYPGNVPGQPKRPTEVAQRDPAQPRPPRPRPQGDAKPKPGEEDPDGMSMGQVDQEGINAVVKSHQKALFPCLAKAAKPGQMIKVPIEFTVASGKVSKVWIDNPDLKNDSTLSECLMNELKKWPFKDAQNASVGLSFNIGKKG
ncbi:MAG: AgmX/PglI C-terminal domain-containing protein [Archangiaceae bacterium]|nr:AgmX/PglI C-terminal domain-containing protein [Archangiaceae bacterium]